MGRVVCAQRIHTTPRVSAIEMPTTEFRVAVLNILLPLVTKCKGDRPRFAPIQGQTVPLGRTLIPWFGAAIGHCPHPPSPKNRCPKNLIQ